MGHKVTTILGSTYRPIMMVRIIEGWPNEPSMIPVEFTLGKMMPAQAREKNGLNRLHHRGAGHQGWNFQLGQSFPPSIDHDPKAENLSYASLCITTNRG